LVENVITPMGSALLIEPLDAQRHDRVGFQCGVPTLDSYLRERANQESQKNIAVTYVLCQRDTTAIIGYYTLSTMAVEPTSLPAELIKRLPRYPVLPAMLTGRLAVDQRYRGQHMGTHLLVNALTRCLSLSQAIGAMAVLVDAKDEHAAQFYQHYGFRRFVDHPMRLFMPMREIVEIAKTQG
jgi:predicted GNAT family N-acyltransferase